MKKIIVVLLFLVVISLSFDKNYIIPNDSIRFRIIPNSNSVEDIIMKEKTTNEVLKSLNTDNISSINSTRQSIYDNIEKIENNIDSLFKRNNYKMNFNINYGLNEFPNKIYKGIEYEKGYYESLVVEIGESSGNNYWCILYPPLCLIEENDISYKSKVIEIIERLF